MTEQLDPTPATAAARGDHPNYTLTNAILKSINSSAALVAHEIKSLNRRTCLAFFDTKCPKHSAPATYDKVAAYLLKCLLASGVQTELKGEMLRTSFPAASLPRPLRQLLGLVDAHAPAPMAGCRAYPTRDCAEDALFRHLDQSGRTLAGADVSVIAFSPHKFIEFVSRAVHQNAARVRLCVGSPALALKLQSRRQAHLIDRELGSEIDTDWGDRLRDARLEVVRYNVPPPFHGYHVKGVAVCVGFYGWFPTFREHANDDEVTKLKADFKAAKLSLPEIDDPITLNGHLMPHVQAVPGPDYDTIAEKFDLQVRAFEEYHKRNKGHKDFDRLDVPNPKLETLHAYE
ncbi:MAG: hypothetical protein FJ304_03290 [Planctomycetes bacterium]|nr:hypothetical protein [Planctomycetota bacterium]